MVKGNWERRAELANVKRQEARERKQLKKSGKIVYPESVLQKLFKDSTLRTTGARIEVFVAHPDAGTVCKAFLRTADCRLKRCRLLHDECVSLSQLRNLPTACGEAVTGSSSSSSAADSSISISEKRCLPPEALDEIMPLKDWNTLMFVAIDGECVYDYTSPDIWNEWITSYRATANNSGRLPTVDEDRDEENDIVDSDSDEQGDDERPQIDGERDGYMKRGKGTTTAVEATAGSPELHSFCGLLERSPIAASHLFSHLTVTDLLCSLLPCSKGAKLCVLRDEGFRVRRREALSLVTRDLSKRKKDEKRKKAKSANVKKVDKKDGFARGGPGR